MLKTESYKNIVDNIADGVYIVDHNRVITYWNKGAAAISGFDGGEVIGKSCKDNVLTHVTGQGQCLCTDGCPLQATLQDGKCREAEVFMHHKNGHRVPVHVSTAPIRDERGNIVAAVEVFDDNSAIVQAKETIETLKHMAMVDSLTGLPNRRYAEIRLASRIDEMRRYGWPFGVIMADVDHFKHVNDTCGHDTGDKVLKMVATVLGNSVRTVDTVGRWGGEEFLAIVANVEPDGILRCAERARMLIEQSYLEIGKETLRVTISMGVVIAERGDSAESLLRKADACLYQSKSGGRNCITHYQTAIGQSVP